jgi:hypothetical protein
MSISLSPITEYEAGRPVVVWRNRDDPFIVGRMTTAHSGKVAVVKNSTDDSIGKPMILDFRLARKAHIDSWIALVDSNPFSTTSISSSLVTGYSVIFNIKNPIVFQNEVLKDQFFDTDQTIFLSSHADYMSGLDLWRGTLNLIITS